MWIYRGKEIRSHSDLHPDCTHIVYLITYQNGRFYAGKKTVKSLRRLKPTKKQLAIRKNYKRVELKELPFVDYEGSHNTDALEIIKKKEILYQCSNARTATYLETEYLFEINAIFNDQYLNKNIGGLYFSNALDGLINE